MTPEPDHLTIPDIRCGTCQSPELRVISPGRDGERHDLFGLLERPIATRGWCSVECARAGRVWPWLQGVAA